VRVYGSRGSAGRAHLRSALRLIRVREAAASPPPGHVAFTADQGALIIDGGLRYRAAPFHLSGSALFRWPFIAGKAVGGIDEGNVAERLREISHLTLRPGVIFLS
jgi:hypothetical protein